MALESMVFGEVVLSTDDRQITDIAIAAGPSVPFELPRELSNDTAPTGAVVC